MAKTWIYFEQLLLKAGILLLRFIYMTTQVVFKLLYDKHQPLPAFREPLLLLSATKLANKIRKKEVSCEQVMRLFIKRIQDVNPIVNAVVCERFEDALQEAKELDQRLSLEDPDQYSEEKKPFLGVPFTAKEAFAMTGLPNTSGLVRRRNFVSNSDADMVELLRRSGAIPVGLTNCSELCMWYESSNLIYGRTNNAYHTGRIVGGSSGGEGCILSCATVIGIGSDIGGSIRMPAFFNGIFGHKGTTGVVSNYGQWPNAKNGGQEFLSTGPMCRYAEDLLPMFKVMVSSECQDQLKLDEQVDLANIRIYYKLDDGANDICSPVHRDIKECIMMAVHHLSSISPSSQGPPAELPLPLLRLSFYIWTSMMNTCGNDSFCHEMGNRFEDVNPYKELFYWLMQVPRHTLPAIGLGLSEKLPMSTDAVAGLRRAAKRLKEDIENTLKDNGVLLYPTHPLPAPYHNQPLLLVGNFAYTGIFNILGLPCTSVPMGITTSEGVPIGLQVIGSSYNDRLTMAVARELEKRFGGWVPPCDVKV